MIVLGVVLLILGLILSLGLLQFIGLILLVIGFVALLLDRRWY